MKITKKILFTMALALPLCGHAQEDITVYDENIGENETMALPEGMQQVEIDSLLKEWNAKTYLTFDGNCNTTGENKTYEPSVYIQRLQLLPNVIEMPYNQVVQKFIDHYSGRLRRTVAIMLGAGNFYNPIFEEALEAYGVPLELKYLPVIESALNPGATSRVGAAGLWQFMIGTGKQYGLEITSLVDERRDPIKASYAAAHYLKDLYDIFGDWTLVIASYNCGPSNISKAIKRSGGEKDYWQIYPYLPAETRGYVPAFIAANYIMNYYCEHNICPVNSRLPQGTDTIMVTHDISLEQIAGFCDIPMEQLRALNPQYRTNLIPGDAKPYSLCMPVDKINAFIEGGDSIYKYRADELLAQREEVDVQEVSSKSSHRGRGRNGRSSRSSRSSSKSVTIRPGDNLGAIARRNHTTVSALRKLNGISGSNIRAGKKLRVR